MLKKFFSDETGLEVSEYAVAAALVALAAVTTFSALENVIKSLVAKYAGTVNTPAQ